MVRTYAAPTPRHVRPLVRALVLCVRPLALPPNAPAPHTPTYLPGAAYGAAYVGLGAARGVRQGYG